MKQACSKLCVHLTKADGPLGTLGLEGTHAPLYWLAAGTCCRQNAYHSPPGCLADVVPSSALSTSGAGRWHQYLSPGLEKRLLMPRLSPATAHSKVPAAKGSWLKLTVLKIRSLGNVATVARISAESSESLRLPTTRHVRVPMLPGKIAVNSGMLLFTHHVEKKNTKGHSKRIARKAAKVCEAIRARISARPGVYGS